MSKDVFSSHMSLERGVKHEKRKKENDFATLFSIKHQHLVILYGRMYSVLLTHHILCLHYTLYYSKQ